MSKAHAPDLKKYLESHLSVKLNSGRQVTGILRGYDPFMNMVLADAVEERKDGEKVNMGMAVLRGNSIIMMEILDRI
ncbi:probable small nuclear ribonucleoprotein G [Nilaparvata lugens]|uniref:probable small nuclear ribonucleoprotein G n=1 Tax=Nilaparvata lugens TaxID=108931 RepID=UPI000B99062E|nr:probable small nuclear ribonucleoprotein G [Nilaparvata lugens]